MEIPTPKPNMANTPEEMEVLIQKAVGKLAIYRAEAWFVPESSHLERFINDVMTGKI